MVEITSLSYAEVTGTIGSITGIAGTIMGYISYRRSGQMKALDLRLELRRKANELRTVVQNLPSLLAHAKQSRTRVASAAGQLKSGSLEQWLANWDTDISTANSLELEVPNPSSDFADLKHRELEARLVNVHSVYLKATQLSEKYNGALAMDDKKRVELSQARARPNGSQ